MHDQVLVAMAGDTPIQPPLKHRKTLVAWQRREGLHPVKEKHNLLVNPPSEIARALHAHVEIGKALIGLNRVLCVVQGNSTANGLECRLDPRDHRTGAKAQAALPQTPVKSRRRQVFDDQVRSARAKPRVSSSFSTASRLCVSAAVSANVATSAAVAALGGTQSEKTRAAISSM